MAMSTGTIGTSMISAILLPMANRAESVVLDQCDVMVNINGEIRNIRSTLDEIKDILHEAEEKQIDKTNVRELLKDLVDIGYEARDELDDFLTAVSISARRTSRSVMFDCLPFSFFLRCFDVGGSSGDQVVLPFLVLFWLANDIKSIRKKLNKIMEQRDIVEIRQSVRQRGSRSDYAQPRPEVGPYVDKQRNLFVGREDVKKEIMEKLLDNNDNQVHVVPIWGMGGVGKTTIAQSIYDDEKVKEDYPSKNRRWFFVGEKKFSAKEIITKIINESGSDDVEAIQRKLVQKLKGGRFLIVLDDVWDVNSEEWKLLWNPLTNVGKGGMIIITARRHEVISATGTPVPKDLKPLSDHDCWLIFESHAFPDRNSDNRLDLKVIGQQIVKELKGLPLAAEVVGRSLLNKQDATTWRNFLNAQEWKLKNNKDDIMPALRWSYNLLPPHLKQCFIYCSLFPKDHVLDEKLLVEMWMAHDLIQNVQGQQIRPEDVAVQYFKELVYASLLQCVDGKYVMHDLVRDLAMLVSNAEYASTNDPLSTDQMEKVRHITIIPSEDYSKNLSLCKSKRLLTVYTPFDWRYATNTTPLDQDVLLDVFRQLKSIRVLVLSHREITEIPDYISDLRHLRYLDISKTSVKRLPNSLCDLHNLQTFAVPLDVILPKDIVNLTNLRHLRANLTTYRGMANLTSLQELSVMSVCGDGNIRELGDLRELRGGITIKGLQNVTCSQEAAQAKMQDKTHIDQLALVFNNDLRETNIVREVLDALQCPPNVTKLEIVGYNGDRSPSWMSNEANFMRSLSHLEIHGCHGLESLQLDAMVSLKYLDIAHCSNLICITSTIHFATTIEMISIALCENLERIEFERSPLLRKLEIVNCEKLISIPRLVVIESLILDHCANLRSLNLQGLNTLGYLKLIMCQVMELIFEEGSNSSSSSSSLTLVSSPLPSLFTIWTDNKHVFTKLLEHDLINLQTLWIDGLANAEYFSETEDNNLCKQTSLECLAMFECKDLKSLPSNLHKLQSLKCLEITCCPELQSLPDGGLPPSLDWLTIEHCPLLFERCKDEFGLDWDKIKHISKREVCA